MAHDQIDQGFAQELYNTYSCSGLTATACGVNQNHPESAAIQKYAESLTEDISRIGNSLGSLATKAIPAGVVAAAIGAVAQIEPTTAGMMTFAAGAAGAVSAFTGPRASRDDSSRSV